MATKRETFIVPPLEHTLQAIVTRARASADEMARLIEHGHLSDALRRALAIKKYMDAFAELCAAEFDHATPPYPDEE